jgi:hypothetical protein
MNKLSQKRLVDGLMQAYVSWREACLRVNDAYGSWAKETSVCATSAFERYTEALDLEEHAAEVYAGLVQRVSQLASSRRDPAEPLGGAASGVGSR